MAFTERQCNFFSENVFKDTNKISKDIILESEAWY